MELTPGNLSALYTRYSMLFQSVFLKTAINWKGLASLFESSSENETHVWMDRVPVLRKWVGDRIIRNAVLRDYVLKNDPFELTLGLDKFKVKDNKIQAFDGTVRMMAVQAKKWPDTLLFNTLTGALPTGHTSAAVTYDGQPFFSTAHPQNPDNPNSATQQNYWASGMPLTHANFTAVRAAMEAFRGADGLPLNVSPNLLVVPPALRTQAEQILQSSWVSPTGTFAAVAAGAPSENPLKGAADILVVPDLGGQDGTWYLLDVKQEVKPFIFQLRDPANFVMRVKPDDPNVFSRHEFQYGVDARGAAGYGPYFLGAKASA